MTTTGAQQPSVFAFVRAHSASAYVVVLALIGPTEIALRAIFTDQIRVFGHTLAVAVPILLVVTAGVLWILDSSPLRPNKYLVLFASLASAVWFLVMYREVSGGIGYNFAAFILIPAVWLLALKPPNVAAARRGADVLILGLALGAVVGTALAIWGYPLSNQFVGARSLFGFLPTIFDYRWVGIFETTTQASAVGSYLLIYGLWRRSWLFGCVALIGLFILVTGYSRGAFAATLVGLLTVMWVRPSLFGFHLNLLRRSFITLGVLLLSTFFIARSDPSLNGRTPIWEAYISELFPRSPLWGLGTSKIRDVVATDPELSAIPAMGHAHNILIDSLARYGLIGMSFVALLLVLSLVVSWRASKVGLWVAPALVVAFIVNQLSDVHVDWRYLDYDYSILVFTVVLAVAHMNKSPDNPALLKAGGSNATEGGS